MDRKKAIFYDVDGTLVSTNMIHVYLYYALRLPKLGERIRKLLLSALFMPAYSVAELLDLPFFSKLLYRNYKGIEEDRIRALGEEVVREAILPNLYEDARKRIEEGKRAGYHQVLVTSSLDSVMQSLAKELGLDAILANRLEFNHGRATGRLHFPVLSGKEKANAIRKYAMLNNIDTAQSFAFGDSFLDLPMLQEVGFPVAVNPDGRLKKAALAKQWPIVEFA